MSGSLIVRSLVVLSLFSLFTSAAFGQCFNALEITPVNPRDGFENTVRYQITYLQQVDGKSFQVFPPRAEKEKDLDLILAQVMKRYLDEEYQQKGRYLDENEVKDSSSQEIMSLISTDYVTPAWGEGNRRKMGQYLQGNSDFLKLYKVVAYTDYQDDRGNYVSGIDQNPLLFKFGTTPDQADEVSLVTIMTADQ